MLNKDNQRELAYVVKIDDIIPHNNADRLEIAAVKGWRVIVGKGEFNAGDLAIYFEIDSKLPEIEPWTSMEFLASKHFKIRTQKLRGELSQGFLASLDLFDWGHDVKEGDFLTEKLGITYATAEDNKRKGSSPDKYKTMAQRHPKQAKTRWWRWLWQRKWGKKLLFLVFGRKSDKKKDWPAWVAKTDEERVENMSWVLKEKTDAGVKPTWIWTEKIDGTSTTFSMKRKRSILGDKFYFYVCSRNVVFDKPEKGCYYDINYYTDMATKYEVEKLLKRLLEVNSDIDWFTIQGETFGPGVQKRDYSLKDVDLRVFNLIDSKNGRWNSETARSFLKSFYKVNREKGITYANELQWVPILKKDILPDTIDELRDYINSEGSEIDGGMREGIVFRSLDGTRSFKCVDPIYLLKYHQ